MNSTCPSHQPKSQPVYPPFLPYPDKQDSFEMPWTPNGALESNQETDYGRREFHYTPAWFPGEPEQIAYFS